MPQHSSATGRSHDLGPQLEPALREVCEGRLHNISWFRTDWQRGGAATALGTLDSTDGSPARDVVIKLPVGPKEYRFTVALAKCDAPTPRLAAHGMELGGYDMAWLIMERLPGAPLASHLHKEVFDELITAAAGYYKHAASSIPIQRGEEVFDWKRVIHSAREVAKTSHIPDAQAWCKALHDVEKHIDFLLARWTARAINTWCHGDLHGGNAMRRIDGSPWGPAGCVLLDFAEVHAGHWVEDAVYLERVHWGRPDVMEGVKPVSMLAKARKAQGLDTSDDYASVANLRRLLTAATVPAFIRHEGQPKHLHAALDVLHRMLPLVLK